MSASVRRITAWIIGTAVIAQVLIIANWVTYDAQRLGTQFARPDSDGFTGIAGTDKVQPDDVFASIKTFEPNVAIGLSDTVVEGLTIAVLIGVAALFIIGAISRLPALIVCTGVGGLVVLGMFDTLIIDWEREVLPYVLFGGLACLAAIPLLDRFSFYKTPKVPDTPPTRSAARELDSA